MAGTAFVERFLTRCDILRVNRAGEHNKGQASQQRTNHHRFPPRLKDLD
jgi:hypothetical protein